ncbi:uncharacterized protein [Venturia canescens]|uniref:uncharacterized protein n=1 Tax=Venturia canescens TaxID=32260 RepID=UPI001C9D53DB|nr:uncharacterized protein LOC122407981 [Venturia canescens]
MLRRVAVMWEDSNRRPRIREEILNIAKSAYYWERWYIITAVVACLAYAVRPYAFLLRHHLYEKHQNVSYDYSLTVYPGKYFWSTDTLGKYILCISWEQTIVTFVGLYAIATDCLCYQLTAHAGIEFRVLQHDLEHLEISRNNWGEVFRNLFHALILGVSSFMHCMYADQVAEQSSLVAEAAYKSQWMHRSKEFKIMLNIIMMRAQRPLDCTIYGLISPNLTQVTLLIKRSDILLWLYHHDNRKRMAETREFTRNRGNERLQEEITSFEKLLGRDVGVLRIAGLFSLNSVFSGKVVKSTMWEPILFTIGIIHIFFVASCEFATIIRVCRIDPNYAIGSFTAMFSGILCAVKGLRIWFWREEFRKLLRLLAIMWNESSDRVQINRENEKTATNVSCVSKRYILMVFVLCSSYALRPYILLLHYHWYEKLSNTSYDYSVTIYPTTYPLYTTDTMSKYIICVSWEQFVIVFVALYWMGSDIMFAQITTHTAIQFRVLRHDLKYITKTLDSKNTKIEEVLVNRLSNIARRHHDLYRHCEMIERIYNPITFLTMLLTAVNMCFCVFRLEKEVSLKNWDEVIKYLFHAVTLIVQAIIYCGYADKLTYQTGLIADAAYDCQWIERSKDFKILLHIIMMRSQKNFRCTAYGFFSVNLNQITVGGRLWFWREELRNLLRFLAVLWNKENTRDSIENIKMAEATCLVTKIHIMMVTILCLSYALRPYILLLTYQMYEKNLNESYDYTVTVYTALYPWSTGTTIKYMLCVTWEQFVLCVVALYWMAADIIFAQLTTHMAIQFRVLWNDLEHITISDNGQKETNEIKLRHQLSAIAKRHCDLYTHCEMIERIFNPIVFLTLSFTAAHMCLCAFHLQKQVMYGNWEEVAKSLFHTVTVIIQGFIYCGYSNKLSLQSSRMAEAAYNCPWIDREKEFKIMLGVIMMRSQKPFICTAYGFFDLNLMQMAAIFKGAGSYFALLQSVT